MCGLRVEGATSGIGSIEGTARAGALMSVGISIGCGSSSCYGCGISRCFGPAEGLMGIPNAPKSGIAISGRVVE